MEAQEHVIDVSVTTGVTDVAGVGSVEADFEASFKGVRYHAVDSEKLCPVGPLGKK